MGSDTDSVLREMSGDQFQGESDSQNILIQGQATNTFVLSHGPSGTDGGSIVTQMMLTSLSDLISAGVQAVMLSVIGVRSNGTIYDAIAGHDVVPPQTAGSLADFLGTLSGMVLGDSMINKAFHVCCSIREQIPTDNMTDVITLVVSLIIPSKLSADRSILTMALWIISLMPAHITCSTWTNSPRSTSSRMRVVPTWLRK